MSTIDLTLGPRPDEPGPPIGGPLTYPPESEAAAGRRRAGDHRAVPAGPLGTAAAAAPGASPRTATSRRPESRSAPGQLGLTDAEVTAVATFYSMYRRTPTGTYLVGVCTNTLCAIMGGDAILEALENHLGVQPGQTTDDGQITLEHVECNAACDYAPVVMVNWEFFDNQTPSAHLRSGGPPAVRRAGDRHPRRDGVLVRRHRPHPRGGGHARRRRGCHRARDPGRIARRAGAGHDGTGTR